MPICLVTNRWDYDSLKDIPLLVWLVEYLPTYTGSVEHLQDCCFFTSILPANSNLGESFADKFEFKKTPAASGTGRHKITRFGSFVNGVADQYFELEALDSRKRRVTGGTS